jgi:hypothetical protein
VLTGVVVVVAVRAQADAVVPAHQNERLREHQPNTKPKQEKGPQPSEQREPLAQGNKEQLSCSSEHRCVYSRVVAALCVDLDADRELGRALLDLDEDNRNQRQSGAAGVRNFAQQWRQDSQSGEEWKNRKQ